MGIIELVGYREWTETLGEDREWKIQSIQSKLYQELQLEAANIGSYLIPLRIDYMVILLENTGISNKFLKTLKRFSPVPFRIAVVKHISPILAEKQASQLLSNTKLNSVLEIEKCDGKEISVIAHIDINNITGRVRENGESIYTTFLDIIHYYYGIQKTFVSLNGITTYLGGDNILVYLPYQNVNRIKDYLDEKLKAGVGIANTPRRAVSLATKALDDIRREKRKNKAIKIYEDL